MYTVKLGVNMKRLLCASVIALLAGCTTTPVKYKSSPKMSPALNVVKASGMQGLRDTVVPREQAGALADSSLYNLSLGAVSYASPAPGVSPGVGAALAVAGWLFGPTPDAKEPQVFFWMPGADALDQTEAEKQLYAMLTQTVEHVANDMQLQLDKIHDKKYPNVSAWKIGSAGTGCDNSKYSESCALVIRHSAVTAVPTPDFVAHRDASSYTPNGGQGSFAQIKFFPKGNMPDNLDAVKFYEKVSEALPEWIYIYVPPSYVKGKNGDPIKPPFLLQKGKPMFFVVPEA